MTTTEYARQGDHASTSRSTPSARTSADGGLALLDLVAGYEAAAPILRGVSLTAHPQQVTVILGPNGAGKSTLLRVVAGFLPTQSGHILWQQQALTRHTLHQRRTCGIGYLPQGQSVFAALSVQENLEMGAWTVARRQRRERIAAMYARYPSLWPLRQRLAGALSGGQQRLLEFARLLVPDPQMLLLDEPSVGLAPRVVEQCYGEIARLKEERRTMVLVDQNVRAAVALADVVCLLQQGRITQQGTRQEVTDTTLLALVQDWLQG